MNASHVLVQLRELAARHDRALVVTHDNPDPDAMAAAAGLGFLLESLGVGDVRLVYGGIIGRAENQALVRRLRLPFSPLRRCPPRDSDLVALVDTQPGHGNHGLAPDTLVHIVVDHHPLRPGSSEVPVPILSSRHGATSSIVTELLREAGLEPPVELSTALYYGVKTDTRSLSREADDADRQAWTWLQARADPALLASIEHPTVPRRWFEAFHRAFERARVHGELVVADIGDVYVPDLVPEVAERLASLDEARWSAAVGVYDGSLYISLRANDRRVNAGKRLQRALEGLPGSAGGHAQMAGARIPLADLRYAEARRMHTEVVQRVVAELAGAEHVAEPLIDPVQALTDGRKGAE